MTKPCTLRRLRTGLSGAVAQAALAGLLGGNACHEDPPSHPDPIGPGGPGIPPVADDDRGGGGRGRLEDGGVGTTTYEQVAYVKASNTEEFGTNCCDNFGFATAFSGNGAVFAVGAPGESSASNLIDVGQDDNSSPRAGAVYVFGVSDGYVSQQAYVKPSNTGSDDNFGSATALDRLGETLVVGAPDEDGAANAPGVDDNTGLDNGAAYVFHIRAAARVQQAYLKAANGSAYDGFGSAVAVSGDADTFVVGSPGEDRSIPGINPSFTAGENGAADSGAAYVFVRLPSGIEQQAYIKASNPGSSVADGGSGDGFGYAVALSDDGDTLAIGAPFESSSASGIDGDQSDNSAPEKGAVYVFGRTYDTWTQRAYIKPSGNDPIFSRLLFGFSVALSGDGNVLAVGAPLQAGSVDGAILDGRGAVHVFDRSEGAWQERALLRASNLSASFGHSIALSLDGTVVAVGSPILGSGGRGVNGDPNGDTGLSGAVWMFERLADSFLQTTYIKSSNADSRDYFGISLGLSGDGASLLTGAVGEESNGRGVGSTLEADNSVAGAGAAYLFAR